MAVFDLKIINGTLVIPGTGKVRAGVGVKDGKVVAIDAEDKLGDATRTVDAAGKYVIPGVIDPHVHLGIFTGDFGYECESRPGRPWPAASPPSACSWAAISPICRPSPG